MPGRQFPVAPPIAIVGVSAIMPGATSVDEFWRNVIEGRDLITDVPANRWLVEDFYDPDPQAPDKTYCKRGAFLPEVEFDPMAFGVPPNNMRVTDSAQLLALIAAGRVLADASGGRPGTIDGERVSVIIGSGALKLGGELAGRMTRPVIVKVLRERGIPELEARAVCDAVLDHIVAFQEASFPGLLANIVAGRVANRFDLHGTNCTVDAACASSLAALSMAVDELTLGRADLVITGGVDTLNDPMMFVCFSKTPALSITGDCRPFDEAADGTILGEGVAFFALKRLSDAESHGDRIYAVIRGIGSSSDGRATSIYGPLAHGQERALRRAYAAAGYRPDTVGLVEAHGTGTVVGDDAEIAALLAVFTPGDLDEGRPWCALGSIKSQIGHTKSAAGAAGLLKAALALHHKVLPPTIKVERPNRALRLGDGPFYLNTTARPWINDAEHPRRASVSSFGFGGTNFHVTLEEYVSSEPGAARAAPRCLARPTELVALSADSPEALIERYAVLVEELALAGDGAPGLATVAKRTQLDFHAKDAVRLAIVAANRIELDEKLRGALRLLERHPEGFSTPTGAYYGTGPDHCGRMGFLFPGQGSQYLNMGGDLANHFPGAQAVWDSAGPGLAEVVFPQPVFSDEERARQGARLVETNWAQTAIAAHSVVLLELLEILGVRPDCVAGHSFGELTALHAAGAFDAGTLLRLASKRGELIRDAAASPGGMLAVAADAGQVAAMIAEGDSAQLWVANHNAPRQVVVAGAAGAMAALEARLALQGVDARRLDAATAFHSPMVASAAGPLREFLSAQIVRAPLLDVYRNADAGVYPIEPDQVRSALAEQVAAPVKFVEMVEAMHDDGVRTFLEVGPGAALAGLVGHILAGRPHRAIAMDRRGRHGVTSLHEAVAQLAVMGVPVVFEALWEAHAVPEDELKPSLSVAISGGNHGRPYPPAAGPLPSTSHTHAVLAEPPSDIPAMTPPTTDRSTLEALVEIQRLTAQAHATYLSTVEASLAALVGNAAAVAAVPAVTPTTAGEPLLPMPPAGAAPALGRSLGTEPGPLHPAPPPVGAGVGGVRQVPSTGGGEVESLVLAVVAAETGYPVDMLSPHLELEADLGIDSIGRLQIAAVLKPMFPDLVAPERVEWTELAAVRTLADIAEKLRELAATSTPNLDPSAPTLTEPERALTRMVTRATPAAACGRPMAGLGQGRLVITHDRGGVAAQLAALLADHGVPAEVATNIPPDASGVVCLGGLGDVSTLDEGLNVQRAMFRMARAQATRLSETGGLFVTVQDTGGAFGPCWAEPARASLGGLAALARTAAQEWPNVSVKAIDCERGGRDDAAVADAIAAELLTGGADLDVGLGADGTRRVLHTLPAPPMSEQPVNLGPESVLVATGGARGITAAALRAVAQRYRPRLVLIGRTPRREEPAGLADAHTETELIRALAGRADNEPVTLSESRSRARDVLAAREIRATLAALEQAGSPTRYVALDVRDHVALKAALEEVRGAWGPITAVLHGAGVLAGQRIVDKTDEQFDDVVGTKVHGLKHLLEATSEDPLRLLCAFSSIAGRFGFLGQCDYTMANETIDQVLAVEQARRPDCRVLSVQWGPWEGGMVTPVLAAQLRLVGAPLIEPDAGGRAFIAELAMAAPDPRVMITGGAEVAGLAQVALARLPQVAIA